MYLRFKLGSHGTGIGTNYGYIKPIEEAPKIGVTWEEVLTNFNNIARGTAEYKGPYNPEIAFLALSKGVEVMVGENKKYVHLNLHWKTRQVCIHPCELTWDGNIPERVIPILKEIGIF